RLLNGASHAAQAAPALVLQVPSAGVLLRMGGPVTAVFSPLEVRSVSASAPMLTYGPVRANFLRAVAASDAMLRYASHRAQRVMRVAQPQPLLSYGAVQKHSTFLVAQGGALRYGSVRVQHARTFAVED